MTFYGLFCLKCISFKVENFNSSDLSFYTTQNCQYFIEVLVVFSFRFFYSLFDDGDERYKKLRQTISQITVCQIGNILQLA